MAIYLGSEQVGGGVDSLSILDLVYPVGSVYYSNNSTNPSTLFGGTWTEEDAPYILQEGGTGVHTSWYYRKWSDGKLECWIKREWSTTIDNSWGSLYYKTYTATPDYPIAFVYNPVIVASCTAKSGNAWATVDKTTQSLTGLGNIYVISPTKVTTAIDTFLNFYVVGRWTANSNIVSKRWTRTA